MPPLKTKSPYDFHRRHLAQLHSYGLLFRFYIQFVLLVVSKNGMTKKTINATFKKLENDSGLRLLIVIKSYDNKNPSSQSLKTFTST